MVQQRYVSQVDMDKLVSLCKRRGFVFQGSEVYGGIGSTWDYGPLGVELKRHVREAWWRAMTRERDDVVGLDAAILMHPRTWEASGHAEGFVDPLVECKACHQRFRADHLWVITDDTQNRPGPPLMSVVASGHVEAMQRASLQLVREFGQLGPVPPLGINAFAHFGARDTVPCPSCDAVSSLTEPSMFTLMSRAWVLAHHRVVEAALTESRMFNLMLKTFLGPVEDTAHQVWLRPETAQGIFVNFQNVLTSTRMRLPFGIAQIGKSFRNEITPGNFVFRTREFEQMELEFFVKPGTDSQWLDYWVQERFNWYLRLGIRKENLRLRQHGPDELAHYAKGCSDVEYRFPWGWAELEGIANRTDFDLRRHAEYSGQDLTYFDQETKERYFPYVIEPSGGVDRTSLALLVDAYDEEPARTAKGETETRVVLRFHPDVAPAQVAVLPLSRNEKLVPTAREVFAQVRGHFMAMYDDAQSIGRRYRRQDEIGTPLCVTVDFQTVEQDNAVTIRDRDTMAQVRVPIPELVPALREELEKMRGVAGA